MTNIYLKFDDEYSARTTMISCGLLVEGEQDSYSCDVDVIGKISVGEDCLPGWHINAILEDVPDALTDFIVYPNTPYRVWFGEQQ